MKRFFLAVAAVFILATFGVALADESSVDTYIKNLKSEDADVRAKAAYDLGCG